MSSTPSGAVVIANNMLYSAGSGLLNCTMQTGTGVSAITIVFGSNITPGTYVIEFDWDPGTLTTSDAFYAVPFDFQTPTSYLGTQMFPTSSVPPAGHYSFLYTPSQTGPTFSTRLLFTTNGSSTHAFKIDNVSMCPLASPPVVNTYTADIESNTDYYAFGQTMPGRTWQGGPAYRFGMNAQLKDNEIYPGAMGAEFWEYDSRIGRRWNVDPIRVPDFSPYSTFLDNPIAYTDFSGAKVDEWNCEIPSGWDNFKGAVMGYLQSLPTDPFVYVNNMPQAGAVNSVDIIANKVSNQSTSAFASNGPGPTFKDVVWVIPLIEMIEAMIVTLTGGAATHAVITYPYATTEKTEYERWIVYEISYVVKDKTSGAYVSGDTYKYGISGQNFNTDGTHPRPETQKNSLTIQEFAIIGNDQFSEYRIYQTKIVAAYLTKLQAEYIEQQLVNAYHARTGVKPEGNQRPLPDVIRGRQRKKFEKITKKYKDKILNFVESLKK